MKKFVIAIGLLIGLFVCAAPVHAVGSDERIKSFDSVIVIDKDDVAHVTETIVYDFGFTAHHGIYRDIPIDYHDGAINYFLTARYGQTTDENGNKVDAEVSEENGNERLKLGNADTTITGVHTYKITYTLSPVVTQKDGHPFLNLDVLGAGWEVPVDSFTASVSLVDNAPLTAVSWYGATGATGSVSQQNIPPYNAITINAAVPDGYVSQYLEPNKPRPFDVWKFLLNFGIFILIALGFGAAAFIGFLRQWKARRLRKSQIVIPEYDPPSGMTPAQIGLLLDDKTDMREITATVIDWAVRGYLKITRVEKKWFLGSATYTLTSLKPSTDMSDTESKLYLAFFSKGSTVTLKDLDKTLMAAAVESYKKSLKSQLTTKGYYSKAGGLIEKGNLTKDGAKQWARVDGFKLYLGVVEKDRLDFSDAPKKTPERFNKLLPYAVALGVEKQWAKQFEGIDVTASTDWYSGNLAAFSAVSLASDIGTSFASTVSSNSSVSSSGGSSGGGVGGGGGGSW